MLIWYMRETITSSLAEGDTGSWPLVYLMMPLNNKRPPCLNSVLIANAVIKICLLNRKRHTSVHSNAHFALIAWPNGLVACARTAEENWCDVQYALKHPSCDILHPVSVTINSRDENYIRSLLIRSWVILLAVCWVPETDVKYWGSIIVLLYATADYGCYGRHFSTGKKAVTQDYKDYPGFEMPLPERFRRRTFTHFHHTSFKTAS